MRSEGKIKKYLMSFLFLFVRWYYREGVQYGLTNVWLILSLILFRFNTLELACTLFAPWKRDIEYRHERGFHPIQALKRYINNTLSRFLGMCVRLPVVLFGMIAFLISSVGVIILYFWFLTAPVLPIAGGVVYWMLNGDFSYTQWIYLASGVGVLFAIVCFSIRVPEVLPVDAIDFVRLREQSWFKRVLARLEIEIRDVPKDAFVSEYSFRTFLKMKNVTQEMLTSAIDIEQRAFIERTYAWRFWLPENHSKKIAIGKGWRFGYTPHLDRYCLDLSYSDETEYGKMGLIGRQAELQVALVVLERPVQNNIFLVGEPGIGKKMFVHHLAKMIRERTFPEKSALNDLRVLIFNLGKVVEDTLASNQNIEYTLRELFQEATAAGNVLLVVEDVDLFLGTDPARPDITHLLEEFLGLPTFRFIGMAVATRYHSLAKKDEQILKFFETVYIRQPNIVENQAILIQFFALTEREQVILTLQAIQALILSSRRYNWEMPYPERVLDLAQQVMIYFRNQPSRFLNEKVVNEYVSLKTGMPLGDISEDEQTRLLNLESELHERVVGQDEAVNQVSQILRKARAGFHDLKRPLGSFLFLGPTGVGKTETVKALAESIFDDEEKMLRLDMSEFQAADSLSRLLGSPEDGTAGILTKAMNEHPYCIVLLDEIEKAHPKVLDIFLQVLDEGMLTDAFGEKISFRNAIITATSNAGSALVKEISQEHIPISVMRKRVVDQVVSNGVFRLEFLNRFDTIVFFEMLSTSQMEHIAELKLRKFVEQVQEQKNIQIVVEPGVTARIVELGYDPVFGARSVNRYIAEHVEDVVARKVIVGSVGPGGTLSIAPQDL